MVVFRSQVRLLQHSSKCKSDGNRIGFTWLPARSSPCLSWTFQSRDCTYLVLCWTKFTTGMRGDFFPQPGRSEGSCFEGSDRIGADGGWIPPLDPSWLERRLFGLWDAMNPINVLNLLLLSILENDLLGQCCFCGNFELV